MDITLAKKIQKKGWMLNPDMKVVNGIVKDINRCEGQCPCVNDSVDKHCPCTNYLEHDDCVCSLFVRKSRFFSEAVKRGKRVFVQDQQHVLSLDLFQNIIVMNIVKDEPVRLAADDDYDKCFMLNNN